MRLRYVCGQCGAINERHAELAKQSWVLCVEKWALVSVTVFIMSKLDRRSDADLVDLCNTGDRGAAIEAFEALYTRHKEYVLHVAYRYVPDPDLALDVLQETFSYVLRKFPPAGKGLDLSSKLQTLLYVAAKNTAISLLRKSNRIDSVADVDPDDLPAPVYRDTGDLAALLRGLSPNQREIIALRFIDDHSLQDIGEILDIPLGTVKSRLHQAIQAMRKSPYVKDFFDK